MAELGRLIYAQGGVAYSWENWRTLTPVVLGLVGLGLFTLHSRLISVPLINASVFRSVTGCCIYAATFLHGIVVGFRVSIIIPAAD